MDKPQVLPGQPGLLLFKLELGRLAEKDNVELAERL